MNTQLYNSAQVDLLSAHFPLKRDPTFAWGNVISMHLALPYLRGFWPMSSVNEAGAAYDLSGQGRTLTRNGTPTYTETVLAPHISLNGATDFLSRADEAGLDVIGTEAYVLAAKRGITIGGWFYANNFVAASQGCIGKWVTATNDRCYLILCRNNPAFDFLVSSAGTAATQTSILSATISARVWYHVVGRLSPSTEQAIFVNGVKTALTVGVPATIFNSAVAGLRVGSFAAAGFLNGETSLNFLCAGYVPDYQIQMLYEHSRRLFGV